MIGLLLEVGLGKARIEQVGAALADPGSARRGAAAPAKGLCLRHVAIGRRTGQANNGEVEE